MTPEERLAELGHELPEPNPPVANYVGAVTVGNIVFVSGHGPYRDGGYIFKGKLGREVDVAAGQKVANGASDLLVEIFGPERGPHARSAVGMGALPFAIPVEIEGIFEIT